MTALRRVGIWLFSLGGVAASLTCSGDPAAPEPRAASIERLLGDAQVGQVNQQLPKLLVVLVKDAQGQPVSGVTVSWSAEGGGSVSATSVVSDADGEAAVQRTLGSVAGPQGTTASVPDLAPVLFSATAEAGGVPHLEIMAQPSTTALSGMVLTQQPGLQIEDGSGEPLGADIPVTVSAEGATLAGTTTVMSDDYGIVQFSDLALSGPPGTYQLTFSSPNFVGVKSVDIVLSAGPTPGGRLVVTTQPSSAAQSGVQLAQQPAVRVEDANGQPLGQGIPVTAAVSGATLAGTLTVQSNASSVAQFSNLALSGPAGSYPISFSAPDLEPAQSSPISLSTTSGESGEWTAPFDWPIVGVHLVLLPNGKVLSIGRVGTPQVWDPATGGFTPVPSPAWLFCSGHVLLPDGRVLVVGGHISDGHGLPNLTYFSSDNVWTSGPTMVRGRWYPTATVMGNGDVVITAGTDQDKVTVPIPEVWSNGSVHQLTGIDLKLPWYPRAFVTPDGRLFLAGPMPKTYFLSVQGSGSWIRGPDPLFGGREYGSAVMYDDGKILYSGGGRTTNTAEVIDLNEASPVWHNTGAMAFARRHHNATVLPTGEVLVTGGVAGTLFNDVSTGVHAAELWDPTSGQWTTLASNAITRGYHGTSLLLPDGRVLNAGSGDGAGAPNERNAELFSPPYLLRDPRPVITSAPSEVTYGSQFQVQTPDAATITKVSFIRLGAVTHAFDENQRFQRLSFTTGPGGLTVTAPSSPNRTPPGHYMLFILNGSGSGVPSVGTIIQIH